MYKHRVQYYETDKMGIVHHSNYIRWMEEARVDFLDHIGYGYDKLEADGVMSPVISVNCNYRKSTKFHDDINIDVKVKKFDGIRLVIKYLMYNEQDELVFEGESSHCFLDGEGRLIRLKTKFTDFYNMLASLEEKADN